MTRRIALLLPWVLAATLALGAAAPAATTVRIGISNSDVAAEPLYANERGTFARAGLAATVTTGMQGGAVLDALANGTIDIGFANIVSIATAIQAGKPLVLLAPGALYTSEAPITVLVQAPGSNYTGGADLDGKTIVTPSGDRDLGAIGTRAWIDAHGGDSRTIHIISGIRLQDVGAALAAHRADASEITEPELSAQRAAGSIKLLAPTFDAVSPHFIIGGFVASRAWVQANPAAARAFVAAMSETAVWADAHHAETAPLLARVLGVPPAVVATMVRATYPATLTVATIQPALDAAARYHVLQPLRAEQLIVP